MNNKFIGAWDSPKRGKFPLGWEIQPLLYDLAPGILQYYFESASEMDEFLGSCSGIGYIHPDIFPRDLLQQYLQISNEYVGKVDKWGRPRKQEWKDIGNVWTFPVVKQGWFGDDGHCAMYPADLPRLAILCGSDEGDLILDPFMGSGTTAQVAKDLKRKYVGYEITEGYKKAINKKINIKPEYMIKIRPDIEKEIKQKKSFQRILR